MIGCGEAESSLMRPSAPMTPRFDEGWRLNEAELCCGDISDGLVREMEKFAAVSGAGCIIRAAEVPVAHGAALEDALTSGAGVEGALFTWIDSDALGAALRSARPRRPRRAWLCVPCSPPAMMCSSWPTWRTCRMPGMCSPC